MCFHTPFLIFGISDEVLYILVDRGDVKLSEVKVGSMKNGVT